MPIFAYRALTSAGRKVTGQLEAMDREAAIHQLESGGLIPVEARLQKRPRQERQRGESGSGLQDAILTRFTRSLSMMLQAGETLERSLAVIRTDSKDRKLDRVLGSLLERIRAGRSLSEAMTEQSGVFPRSYLSLVRASEMAGRLGETLEDIARSRERGEALRRKLVASLTYPALLLASAVIAVAVLLVYVVPQFSGLFSGRDGELPALTRLVITVSSSLTSRGIEFLLGIAVAVLVVPRLLRFGVLQRGLERLLLATPGLGPLLRERVAAQFSASLATLLEGGLDLPMALQLTRDGLSMRFARDALREVESDVRNGMRFVESLRRYDLLPATALSLYETGEASGRLREISTHLAALYEERLTNRLTQLVAIVEPALVIILGLVVGAIVMSILSAVLSLNELAL